MNFLVLLLTIILVTPNSYAKSSHWQNVCPATDVSYCKDVGKYAYNNSTNSPFLRGVKLGKIIGVIWRPKGSVIGISEAIPKANIPKEIRTSPRDAYYYIIDDGIIDDKGKKIPSFLRQCREIDAKDS